ncbi:hypothetical protein [Pseudonocardia sp. NPDC049154]|uniref:hypothetical protein n=1 Tax=Pseudonocardia sp. NPDC049154 TaxID=3155501 RepID=UPI0033E706E2
MTVRFDADRAGEWTSEAREVVLDGVADLAAIVIAPPAGGRGVDGVPEVDEPVLGRVGDSAAVLAAVAVGFPRFKARPYRPDAAHAGFYRDSHQIDATIAVLSNRRENTLEITVAPPERDPDPAVSPWEGMSGAAVWAGGCLVGVLTAHHRSDGLGRLTATRIDAAERGGRFAAAVGLPADPAGLPDVVPPPTAALAATAYRLQVVDIAPPSLRDREPELAELARFCSGPEPYVWWQGEPWAGKTALMAWFALHPPAGVDVVSFFVVGGLAGQSDSEAFLEACAEQLTVLAHRPPGAPATTAARQGRLLELISAAVARSRAAGRRLVLVVDGLDEDTGPGTHQRSIASLLPRRPVPGLRIVVTSRPDPELPSDVPVDHPLRGCVPRGIPALRGGRDEAAYALRELEQQLLAGSLHQDLLGLIAAARGGLSLDDLVALSGWPSDEVRALLRGALGRTVRSRVRRLPGSAGAAGTSRGYLFAHETLRRAAEHMVGPRVDGFRARLHDWAESYRARGWPASTPTYLLRDYARMLAAVGDHDRLVALAGDRDRHLRLRAVTGGDALALDEIAVARTAAANESPPDLVALTTLALRWEDLVHSNASVPVGLPAVWATLGDAARAESLARSAVGVARQAEALALASLAAGRAGYLPEAEVLVAAIENLDRRDEAVAALLAQSGSVDVRRARRMVDTLMSDEARSSLTRARLDLATADDAAALVAGSLAGGTPTPLELATALAGAGRHEEVRAVLPALPKGRNGAEAHRRVAVLLARSGASEAAEDVVLRIRAPLLRARALVEVLGAGGALSERSDRLADALCAAAHDAPDPAASYRILLDAAVHAVEVGRVEQGRKLARAAEDVMEGVAGEAGAGATDPGGVAVARAVAREWPAALDLLGRCGHRARPAAARTMALVAEAAGDRGIVASLVRGTPSAADRAELLTDVAQSVAVRGDRDRTAELVAEVERVARGIGDPKQLSAAAEGVIDGLLTAGRLAEAESLAARAVHGPLRESALGRVALALVRSGRHRRAESIARTLPAPQRARVTVALARHLIAAGAATEAAHAMESGLRLVDDVDDAFTRVVLLAGLAVAFPPGCSDATPHLERAEAEAEALDRPERRARALSVVAAAVRAAAPDPTDGSPQRPDLDSRAAGALEALPEPARTRSRAWLTDTLAREGHVESARAHATLVRDPASRVRAECALAAAARTEYAEAVRRLGGVRTLIGSLDGDEARATALVRLAETGCTVLGSAVGQPGGAAAEAAAWVVGPVADLLSGPFWARAAPALARACPEAFSLIHGWVETHSGAPGGSPAPSQ